MTAPALRVGMRVCWWTRLALVRPLLSSVEGCSAATPAANKSRATKLNKMARVTLRFNVFPLQNQIMSVSTLSFRMIRL